MRTAELDTPSPAINGSEPPWRFEQDGRSLGAALLLLLLLVLSASLVSAFALLLTELAVEPATRSAVAAQPAAALKIALGIALSTALVGWPIRTLALRLGSRREVVINHESVDVIDRGLFTSRRWRSPIGSYLGLAHHIRSSHSGLSHELVLVHPNRRANVLVGQSSCMTESDVAAACHRLGLPLVSAKLLYGNGRPRPVRNQPTAAPATALAA